MCRGFAQKCPKYVLAKICFVSFSRMTFLVSEKLTTHCIAYPTFVITGISLVKR